MKIIFFLRIQPYIPTFAILDFLNIFLNLLRNISPLYLFKILPNVLCFASKIISRLIITGLDLFK